MYVNEWLFLHITCGYGIITSQLDPSDTNRITGFDCSVIFPGAEDVVMAFSRSETEDRRQWPLAMPSHYSWTQHNTVDWWRERSLRQDRGGALLHASCPTSLLFPIPLFFLTLTVTLSGPVAALPGDLQQTSQKESWRVNVWFGFFKFLFFFNHASVKWRFIFVPMRDLMDQELHLSGQTTKKYKSPYGLLLQTFFFVCVYVVLLSTGSCR